MPGYHTRVRQVREARKPTTPSVIADPLEVLPGGVVNYQIRAFGQVQQYDVTPLPAGLSLDRATGLLTGTYVGTAILLTVSAHGLTGYTEAVISLDPTVSTEFDADRTYDAPYVFDM